MNKSQELELRKDLQNKSLLKATERNLAYEEEDQINYILSKLRQDESYEFDTSQLTFGAKYILHEEIKARFPNLNQTHCIIDEIMLDLQGFSRIIQILVENEKPLVGHNCLSDMIRIYQNFIDELPIKYNAFKAAIHAVFPLIYDTKRIAFHSRRKLEEVEWLDLADDLRLTSLSELYQQLKNVKNKKKAFMYTPQIRHSLKTKKYSDGDEDFCHEAGFDAFMSGVVFIQLAHVLSGIEFLSFERMKPMNFYEHLAGVEKYKNLVNLGRGAVNYVNFEREDPASERPAFLVVTSELKPKEIAQVLARYGSVDVKPLASNNANLVAVSNDKT